MPTYDTPTPVDLHIDLHVGSIEVIASDRTDAAVTLSARNPEKASGGGTAPERSTVDFDGRRLTVTGPRPCTGWVGPSKADSVDVKVELPTGSRLTAKIGIGSLRTTGRLGATRITSTHGIVDVEAAGELRLRSSHGAVTVGTVEGTVDLNSEFGPVEIGTVTGSARFRATHGGVHVDEAHGALDARLAYGALDVTRAYGSVRAETEWGSVTLGEVSSGSIHLESGLGSTVGAKPHAPVTVGIQQGASARAELSSANGRVRNELDAESTGDPAAPAVDIQVRSRGDITVFCAR